MTLDEVIKHCEEVAEQYETQADKWEEEGGERWGKTLSCRECAREHKQLGEWLKDYKRLLNKQTCKDAINRQVVKEQMIKYGFHAPDMTVTEFVEDLLPIAPTHKKGKWIVEIWNNREHHTCSDCQRVVDYEPCYHYCPYCGEEKESEE